MQTIRQKLSALIPQQFKTQVEPLETRVQPQKESSENWEKVFALIERLDKENRKLESENKALKENFTKTVQEFQWIRIQLEERNKQLEEKNESLEARLLSQPSLIEWQKLDQENQAIKKRLLSMREEYDKLYQGRSRIFYNWLQKWLK